MKTDRILEIIIYLVNHDNVPARERLWMALLLSFGSRVKVIGPESYKKELIETAQNFLSNYDMPLSHRDDIIPS